MSTTQETMKLRLILDVTYTPNGVSEEYLLQNLHDLATNEIHAGRLTSCSEAEVEDYLIITSKHPETLSEDEVISMISDRIDNGLVDEDDIPTLMGRYGLMEPGSFVEEMLERKQMADEEMAREQADADPKQSFSEQFEAFKHENAEAICLFDAFFEKVDDAGLQSEIDSLLDDAAADIKASVGAEAANHAGEVESDQEAAIDEAAAWVTNNISNASQATRIAAALWCSGFDEIHSLMLKAGKPLPLREVSKSDIESVLREYALHVTNTDGRSFREMARVLSNEVEWEPVQSHLLLDYIHEALVGLGVISEP